MRQRFVTCSWCFISPLREPTRRALRMVYRGTRGLRDRPVQGLGLRPWRSPVSWCPARDTRPHPQARVPARSPRCAHRLLCPGRGHPAERRRGRPRPWGAGTPPWTRASGGEEERLALSPEAGTCPSTSLGAGRYPAVKNGLGGRSEGRRSAYRHLGVAVSPF